LIDEHKY